MVYRGESRTGSKFRQTDVFRSFLRCGVLTEERPSEPPVHTWRFAVIQQPYVLVYRKRGAERIRVEILIGKGTFLC